MANANFMLVPVSIPKLQYHRQLKSAFLIFIIVHGRQVFSNPVTYV